MVVALFFYFLLLKHICTQQGSRILEKAASGLFAICSHAGCLFGYEYLCNLGYLMRCGNKSVNYEFTQQTQIVSTVTKEKQIFLCVCLFLVSLFMDICQDLLLFVLISITWGVLTFQQDNFKVKDLSIGNCCTHLVFVCIHNLQFVFN